eukprot:13578708-Ditylum_brightwellii.AAC.1
MKTGAWMTVVPDRLIGTELSAEEFWDNLRLSYGLVPLGLPKKCDGCGQNLSVEHALLCAHGGLVLIWHNNTCGEWGDLGQTGLIPSAVSYEPLIHSGGAAAEEETGSSATMSTQPVEDKEAGEPLQQEKKEAWTQ